MTGSHDMTGAGRAWNTRTAGAVRWLSHPRPRPDVASRRRLGEWLAGDLIFPAWVRYEHGGYAGFRHALERSQYFSPADLHLLQQRRLADLLAYAGEQCPFYRERFRHAGWGAATPDGEAWRALPLLTRRDLQTHGFDLRARAYPRRQRQLRRTGGTTGTPLEVYIDRARLATRLAGAHRHNAWAGHHPGDWMAVLWGPRADANASANLWDRCRRRLLYRTLEFNTDDLETPDWERCIRAVRRFRPRFLLAYAQAAVAFAEYVRARGLDDIGFQSIITTAEASSPEQRRFIESTLGGRVFNRYGCQEFSLIASECEAHSGLHVNAESLLVEIVPDPALPAPWGRVVVTDLLNRSMPLIRYDIGDVARWSEKPCSCGRGLPILAEVACRTNEYLALPDGSIVAGPGLIAALAGLDGILQAQFVQHSGGDILLRLVPGPGYDVATRRRLRARLHRLLGKDVPLRLEVVDVIPNQPSGKHLLVIQPAPTAAVVSRERVQ